MPKVESASLGPSERKEFVVEQDTKIIRLGDRFAQCGDAVNVEQGSFYCFSVRFGEDAVEYDKTAKVEVDRALEL